MPLGWLNKKAEIKRDKNKKGQKLSFFNLKLLLAAKPSKSALF
jgi:hypothetical protein